MSICEESSSMVCKSMFLNVFLSLYIVFVCVFDEVSNHGHSLLICKSVFFSINIVFIATKAFGITFTREVSTIEESSNMVCKSMFFCQHGIYSSRRILDQLHTEKCVCIYEL